MSRDQVVHFMNKLVGKTFNCPDLKATELDVSVCNVIGKLHETKLL